MAIFYRALKRDVTRKGRRTGRGVFDDGINSAKRYFINNFKDPSYQKALDYFLGNSSFNDWFIDHKQKYYEKYFPIQSTSTSINHFASHRKVVKRIPKINFRKKNNVKNKILSNSKNNINVAGINSKKAKFSKVKNRQTLESTGSSKINKEYSKIDKLFLDLIDDIKSHNA